MTNTPVQNYPALKKRRFALAPLVNVIAIQYDAYILELQARPFPVCPLGRDCNHVYLAGTGGIQTRGANDAH